MALGQPGSLTDDAAMNARASPAAAAAAPADIARLACPRCRGPMAPLVLSSHTGRSVTVDHCGPCRQVWFEQFESVALDARGWIRLLRQLEAGAGEPAAEAALPSGGPGGLACPACQAPLRTVSNLSRFGRFTALECPQRHGHLHGQAGVLAERGLVRPLGARERKALLEEQHRITCFNCGAPADGQGDRCGYCQSPLVVIDLPRLAQSLAARVVDEGLLPAVPGRSLPWRCRSCGTSLDPARHAQCPQCGHLVVSLELPDIEPLLEAAEAALDARADARVAARVAARAAPPAATRIERARLAEGAYGPPALDRRPSEILEGLQRDTRHWDGFFDLGRILLHWLRVLLHR